MRLTSKGQVTIPQEIRDKLGLHPGTEVEFDIVDDAVRIRRADTQEGRRRRVRAWIERARGSARHTKVRLTTDEIMALTRGED
jgi:AbrB family looped-hinge helix DNA binding protein